MIERQIEQRRETDKQIYERIAADVQRRVQDEQREAAAFARLNQIIVWQFESGVLPTGVYDN